MPKDPGLVFGYYSHKKKPRQKTGLSYKEAL